MTKFLHFNVALPPKASLKIRKQYQSRTVAVEPYSNQDIMMIAQDFLNTDVPQNAHLKLGVTFCSLKDRYSKKEGRKQAIAKQAYEVLDVKGVQVTPTHVFIFLSEFKGITLVLRLNKKSGFSSVVGTLSLEE